MKRFLSVAASALAAIILGVACEWVLLTGSTPQAVASAVVQSLPPPVVHYARPEFQTGVVFARWGTNAYGAADANWGVGLSEIQQQTGARWIEMTIDLYQPTYTSLQVTSSAVTPSLDSFAEGIRVAHARGFHVFVAPMITVGRSGWSGLIHFHTSAETTAWFHNYWQFLEPYVVIAADEGAEQFSLGTEYATLEQVATPQWAQLIDEAHTLFSGKLTYDVNFTSLTSPARPWMRNPNLSYVGVSEYQPLTRYSQWLDPATINNLWNTQILSSLDQYAAQIGKPLVLSEIGYRNGADALYEPWHPTSNAPPDPNEQAAAYNAALSSVIGDHLIAGIYFWGWSIPHYEPNWLPAASVMHHWYTSPQS